MTIIEAQNLAMQPSIPVLRGVSLEKAEAARLRLTSVGIPVHIELVS